MEITGRTEFLLSLINRGATPVFNYLALVVLGRILDGPAFENYLVLMTIAMWWVAGCFQWQKNAVIRFFSNWEEQRSVFLKVFLVVFGVSSALIASISGLFFDVRAWNLLPFVLFFGLNNLVGPVLRVWGYIPQYNFFEIMGGGLRWVFGIMIVLVWRDPVKIFWGLSLGIMISVMAQVIFCERRVKRREIPHRKGGGEQVNAAILIKFGGFLMIADFFSSGLMYVDRLVMADWGDSVLYIVSSNIGNQIVSVVCGAFLMVVYPRTVSNYKNGGEWKKTYFGYLKKFPMVVGACLVIGVCLGPVAVKLVRPGIDFSYELLVFFITCQSLYYLTVLIGMPMIILNMTRWNAILNMFMFIIYSGLIYTVSHYAKTGMSLLLCKSVVYIFGSLLISMVTVAYFKRTKNAMA